MLIKDLDSGVLVPPHDLYQHAGGGGGGGGGGGLGGLGGPDENNPLNPAPPSPLDMCPCSLEVIWHTRR